MTTLYHGSEGICTPHRGLCLATTPRDARDFALDHGLVTMVGLDWTGLVVREERAYDPGEDVSPGDDPDELDALGEAGVDVITFDDQDVGGSPIRAYRLVSERAVAAIVTLVEIEECDDADDDDDGFDGAPDGWKATTPNMADWH